MANDNKPTTALVPAPHTAWYRWPAGQREAGKLPDIVMDVPLTLRRGYTIWRGAGEGQQINGPQTDIAMANFSEAWAHKQKFDERGRIGELKARRDVIHAEWMRAKDRALDPVPAVAGMLKEWSQEDGYRVAAGTLAMGPCVLDGRRYRHPKAGETIPPAQVTALAAIDAKSVNNPLAALANAVARLAGGAVPAGASA